MRVNFLEKASAAARESTELWKGRYGKIPERMERDRPEFLPRAGKGCSVISEVKMASPSRGDLMGGGDPMRLPPLYESAGASAVSVVVEEKYFNGSPELFRKVGEKTGLPLLWKDFVVDPYQISLAAAMGASAVLLIVGMLSDSDLTMFLKTASDEGLRALVEVHDARELERAVASGSDLIGVNNRDLVTLEVDTGFSRRLSGMFPQGVQRVSESGIRSPEDVASMASLGYRAVLIGESLVTDKDPEELLRKMVEAGKTRNS